MQIRRKGYPASAKPSKPSPMPKPGHAWSKAKSTVVFLSLASRPNAPPFINSLIEIAPTHKVAYSEIRHLEALKRNLLVTRIDATLTSSDFARYRD
ncbi:hypothetical protein [Pseudomonas syringae]|uniref:hypothetical protein n=1 Tax=Pseudomonas syringae TaxID=317 RepID=UPI001F355A35|nr:hypothetical protein [Pseudomonas syringae]